MTGIPAAPRRGRSAVAFAAPLVAVGACVALSSASGCALVMNLNGNDYALAEAGPPDAQTCDADTGCTGLTLNVCISAKDCMSGQVCCLTATAANSADIACVSSSACTIENFGVQLCASSEECGGNGTCTSERCTLQGGTVTLNICQSPSSPASQAIQSVCTAP